MTQRFKLVGKRRGLLVLAATATIAAVVLTGCSAPASTGSSADNGTTLTLWSRSDTGVVRPDLVALYNKTHKNKVKLTIIPANSYQEKVGAAAGSGGLPDILSADVTYSPNYVQAGLFQNITSEVKGLSFYKGLAKAHMQAASLDGKIYGVPLEVDSSLILYNKTLFKEAGLDPSHGPQNFNEIYTDAKAIRDKVGGDVYGFYWGGDCPGCNAYSMFPYAVAAGEPPFKDDGRKADINSPALNATLALYKKMTDEGIIPASAKTENGDTWTNLFNEGKIGILPAGSFDFGSLAKVPFQWGIAGLPAPNGGKTATFVGGDMAGITKDSKHFAQAWNFLSWMLGEKAQVDVIAKTGNLPSRVDLAGNKYSAADPWVEQTIKGLATGYTPSTTQYGAVINDPTGPWLLATRNYVYSGQTNALAVAQSSIQATLNQAYKKK